MFIACNIVYFCLWIPFVSICKLGVEYQKLMDFCWMSLDVQQLDIIARVIACRKIVRFCVYKKLSKEWLIEILVVC